MSSDKVTAKLVEDILGLSSPENIFKSMIDSSSLGGDRNNNNHINNNSSSGPPTNMTTMNPFELSKTPVIHAASQ